MASPAGSFTSSCSFESARSAVFMQPRLVDIRPPSVLPRITTVSHKPSASRSSTASSVVSSSSSSSSAIASSQAEGSTYRPTFSRTESSSSQSSASSVSDAPRSSSPWPSDCSASYPHPDATNKSTTGECMGCDFSRKLPAGSICLRCLLRGDAEGGKWELDRSQIRDNGRALRGEFAKLSFKKRMAVLANMYAAS